MSPRTKLTYHPHLIIAFHLNCLPEELTRRIPRSTRFDWSRKDLSTAFGSEWASQQHQLFATLQQVANSQKLLRINIALLRVIAIKRFLSQHTATLASKAVQQVIIGNIEKVSAIFKLSVVLKYLQRSTGWFQQLRTRQRCSSSPSDLCRLKHPGQLLLQEVNVIKNFCSDSRFITWPLVSVYHQIRREKAAVFELSTFYKYVRLLQLERRAAAHRRKNHSIGLRAGYPLTILHADVTLFRTADNIKNYIYLIQDNFSRAILLAQVSVRCSASITLNNIDEVHRRFLVRRVLSIVNWLPTMVRRILASPAII